MTRIDPHRRRGRRLALPGTALAALTALAGLHAGGDPALAGATPACPSGPGALSPKPRGPAGKRYTMLLRVNKLNNVYDYANPDPGKGGLRKQLRKRDVFVINTRYKNSSPTEWLQIADQLRADFPCNRIVALNGLASNPERPGYSEALADHPGLWALALDWESGDWNQGRKQKASIPPWSSGFSMTLGRIGKRLARLGGASKAALGNPGLRTGIVPALYPNWDFGLIARVADRRNMSRRKGRRGFQIVQTQGYCSTSGPADFAAITNALFRQYRPKRRVKKIKRHGKVRKVTVKVKPRGAIGNLALEVSFSDTPDPNDSRPVARITPGAASKCTRAGLKRGVGAVLYWAHPGSIRALLNTPRICALRPPC